MSDTASRKPVVVGSIGAAHGVHGWVKVNPFTESRDTLLEHAEWLIARGGKWHPRRLLDGRGHGRQLVVRLDGVQTREQARALTGCEVALWRDQLPALEDGDYYWSDLVGLAVWTARGEHLGTVERVMETGANDVLVVNGERERLVPYLSGTVVRAVDLDAGRMEVDWDPEF